MLILASLMITGVASSALFRMILGIKVLLLPQINSKQANRISGGWLVNEIHDTPVPRRSLPAAVSNGWRNVFAGNERLAGIGVTLVLLAVSFTLPAWGVGESTSIRPNTVAYLPGIVQVKRAPRHAHQQHFTRRLVSKTSAHRSGTIINHSSRNVGAAGRFMHDFRCSHSGSHITDRLLVTSGW